MPALGKRTIFPSHTQKIGVGRVVNTLNGSFALFAAICASRSIGHEV
jgi:hypothetical protein